MRAAQFKRAIHVMVNWMIGGLEAEKKQRAGAITSHRETRLARIDEAAVGRMQTRLGKRTYAIDAS